MRAKNTPKSIQYIESVFAQPDEVLQKVQTSLESEGKTGIAVSPHEGRILQVLMKMIGAKTGVEIGMLHGYSTIWMARALPEDGKVYSLEKDPKCIEIAKGHFESAGLSDKIEVLEGDAITNLNLLESNSPFDFVFIDANKSGYVQYLDWAIENVRPGGLIIGDNTFLFGDVYKNPPERSSAKQVQVMKDFNQKIACDPRLEGMMLPTEEGMTVALRV